MAEIANQTSHNPQGHPQWYVISRPAVLNCINVAYNYVFVSMMCGFVYVCARVCV